jgi:parallel beta-helix repeat protein
VSRSNNIEVESNSVLNTGNHGIEVSVGVFVTVQSNTLQNNSGDGILLSNGGSNTVDSNTVSHSGTDGIVLTGVVGIEQNEKNVVEFNTVEECGIGILVSATTADNLLKDNTSLSNTIDDLEDLSTGHGTAGTANTWTGNIEHKDNHNGGLGH